MILTSNSNQEEPVPCGMVLRYIATGFSMGMQSGYNARAINFLNQL